MKFYICPSCGNLTTSVKIERGIPDYSCYCRSMQKIFNKALNTFDLIITRQISPYEEIPTWLYIDLKKTKNDVLRLEFYNSWKKAMGE
jgi:hypothetical protein